MRRTAVLVVVVMVGALVVAASGLAWAAARVSFAPETNYEAGLSPFASLTDWPHQVTSADFDGDGDRDLATANQEGDDVSVLLGRGDGTFGTSRDFAAGDWPNRIHSADFDEDGNPDLAVSNIRSSNVSVFLGKGDGTFATQQNLAAGDTPTGVASADLNGDGKLDLIVANAAFDNNVSVFLGKGDGSFAARKNFAVGKNPLGIAIADFDEDDNLDLAVSNLFSNNVSVLLGKGDGTFAAQRRFTIGASPGNIVSPDFDEDGNFDLAATTCDGTLVNQHVSVLMGNGEGSFATPERFVAGHACTGLTSADFDGDGNLDLATSHQLAVPPDGVSVLLGKGDGTFRVPQSFAAQTQPIGITSADFDGDGKPDIAVTNILSDTVSILLNTTGQDPDARCTIKGTSGPDELVGTSGHDFICGFNGDDTIRGRGDNDTVLGDKGDDTVLGGSGNDTLKGGIGRDILRGVVGKDNLYGENGDDRLDARDDEFFDDDWAVGGEGVDTCLADTLGEFVLDFVVGCEKEIGDPVESRGS